MSDLPDVESPIDLEATADDLDVAPAALAGVVDHFEQRGRRALEAARIGDAPYIADVLAYNNAIAVVRLTDGVSHTDGGESVEHAVVDFNGYVFPFAVEDLGYLMELADAAGLAAGAGDRDGSELTGP